MLLYIRAIFIVFAFLCLTFFSNTLNAASLSIANNLVLRELDDQAIENSFFAEAFSKNKSVELTKGEHTLLIKYKDVYEDLNFAEDRLVESELFIVKFTLAEQQYLTLMTPTIKDLPAAERFARTPEIILADEKNKSLVLQLQKYSDYKLAKQVENIVTSLPQEKPQFEESIQPLSASENSVLPEAKNNATHETDDFNEQVLTHAKSLPMLKYWWGKASDSEKQDFTRYIQGQ